MSTSQYSSDPRVNTLDKMAYESVKFGRGVSTVAAVVLTIVGLGIICLGIYLSVRVDSGNDTDNRSIGAKQTAVASGRVTARNCHGFMCTIDVTYRVDGKSITVTYEDHVETAPYTSDTVTVHYDPSNASSATVLPRTYSKTVRIIGFILAGLLVIGIGWIWYYVAHHSMLVAGATTMRMLM